MLDFRNWMEVRLSSVASECRQPKSSEASPQTNKASGRSGQHRTSSPHPSAFKRSTNSCALREHDPSEAKLDSNVTLSGRQGP